MDIVCGRTNAFVTKVGKVHCATGVFLLMDVKMDSAQSLENVCAGRDGKGHCAVLEIA